jgi:hypothetical protein
MAFLACTAAHFGALQAYAIAMKAGLQTLAPVVAGTVTV